MNSCKSCSRNFEITDSDRSFYDKISPEFGGKKYPVLEPELCTLCRRKRRLSWRSERSLYSRKCDFTGDNIISLFHPDSPYKVYKPEIWYGDKWDPCEYGQDYDPDRPFFDQYREVQLNTPKLALIVMDNENSPYVSQSWHLRNCYLCYDVGYSEDVFYAYSTYHSKNSMDICRGEKLELCYEAISCSNSYRSIVIQDCHNCNEAYFSYDCQGSKNILFCSNLRNQEYMIENKKVSPDEFKRALSELKLNTYSGFSAARIKFLDTKAKAIHRENHNINCQNCTGDYLQDCKECQNCFECFQAEDCKNITRSDHKAKDIMDCDHVSELELAYSGVANAGYQLIGCYNAVYSKHTYYSDILFNSQNCFGCSSMNRKEYCILNKQYTKDEYEELVPRIIKQMIDSKEWGHSLPPEYSLFGYNETLANEYWPLSREEALKSGYLWTDYQKPDPTGIKTIPAEKLPDNIDDIPDDVLDWAIVCENTGKAFKVISQELKFYREMGISFPRRHPDQRHVDRQAIRNPGELFKRTCSKCAKDLESSYSSDRPEKLYCEECYLKEIY